MLNIPIETKKLKMERTVRQRAEPKRRDYTKREITEKNNTLISLLIFEKYKP